MKTEASFPEAPSQNIKYQAIILLTLAVVGIALAIFSFFRLRNLEQNEFSTDFKRVAENRIYAIQRSINSKVDEILSLQAFFDASEFVEKAEFQIFARSLLQHETDVQALEWIPLVLDAKRRSFEESARQEVVPDFQITERANQGIMVQAGKREEYYPVYYLEPLAGNEMALGFDLGSEPARYEALNSSRDTGRMKATGKITLVQETEGQNAFLLFQPIYNKVISSGSIRERRENLKGFVLGVFRIGALVEDALSAVAPGGADLYLYDASEPDPGKSLLYSHASRSRLEKSLPPKDEEEIKRGYYYSLPVKVADREWHLYAVPTPYFIAARKNWQTWGVPGIIFSFTIFCIGYLMFVLDRSEESKRHSMVLSMTIKRLEIEIDERHRTEKELLAEKENLREALLEIRTLRGILPICSYCKKIRDDQGLWNQLEAYILSHSEAEFTHGACPECYQKQMDEIKNIKKSRKPED